MEATQGPDDGVLLRLSADEALVLFDWIHRHEDVDTGLAHLVEDEAERQALWAVSAALEKRLPEPFDPEYRRLLEEAKQRLTPDED